MRIAVIDYGMGNLRSVQKAFEKVGAAAIISAPNIKRFRYIAILDDFLSLSAL